ncbi:MAG: hypothetical protein PHE55_13305 [Methylococcaceae bacterium]|nr:hypothetical protein [Methylococcaceae bacterium]
MTLATDATFAFTADVHVSFNGYDDHQGIFQSNGSDYLLLFNETLKSIHDGTWVNHDRCAEPGSGFGFVKDLCNQIQLVRKLNHLPNNFWYDAAFQQRGHQTTLASAGRTIGTPQGLIVAGDLTDCGAGSKNVQVWDGGLLHSENCTVDYGDNGDPGAQLKIFQQLFDKESGVVYKTLATIPVIPGLRNPDSDVPLQYPVFPGLGNHDLGFDQSGLMMDYIRQWNFVQLPSSSRHVTNSDPISGAYSWNWGRLHIVNAGVYAGSSNTSKATDQNYGYSQDAMNWLIDDLKSFASDGRPKVSILGNFPI